jgi:hypothetical protein
VKRWALLSVVLNPGITVTELVDLTENHTIKAYWGNGGITPRIDSEMSGQLHAPATLPPGKEPPVPIR